MRIDELIEELKKLKEKGYTEVKQKTERTPVIWEQDEISLNIMGTIVKGEWEPRTGEVCYQLYFGCWNKFLFAEIIYNKQFEMEYKRKLIVKTKEEAVYKVDALNGILVSKFIEAEAEDGDEDEDN